MTDFTLTTDGDTIDTVGGPVLRLDPLNVSMKSAIPMSTSQQQC